MPQIRDQLSRVPISTELYYENEFLGAATSFAISRHNRTYLVTNWHNVSGRRPDTGKPVCSNQMALPDRMVIFLAEVTRHGGGRETVKWNPHVIPFYSDEDRLKPLWFEHPVHGHQVDVAVFGVELPERVAFAAANCRGLGLDSLQLCPGMDAFVLGFPVGMHAGGRLPIWKRATIANETEVDLDGLPKFYVDTATRKGMSGSPVYAVVNGAWSAVDPVGMQIGQGRDFIGIYSGRVGGSDEFAAQLGIVWRKQAIFEVIDGEVVGTTSF